MRSERRRSRRYEWVRQFAARKRAFPAGSQPIPANEQCALRSDGRFFTTPQQNGTRVHVDLSRRGPLARLLALFASRPAGSEVSAEDLVRAGWPEERWLARKAAANRLHVAIATLRKMGLAPVIRSTPRGYALEGCAVIAPPPAIAALAGTLSAAAIHARMQTNRAGLVHRGNEGASHRVG